MKHNWESYFDIQSEYWKKVEKIYEDNEHFPKIIVKERNLHHKFPRSFSKKDGVAIDNDDDNLVSLSLSDHFLVHYYLWKCANKGYRGMMALAFNFMRKKMVKYASEETIEQLARDYEAVMKDVAKAHRRENLSKETRKKMSEAQKGKQAWNKGKSLSEETKKRMSNAKKNMSEKTKKKLSETHKGKHHTKETKMKISAASKGKPKPLMTTEHRKNISKANKGKNKGKHHSEQARKKIGAAKKGTCWYNNGEINIRARECPNGFVPGRLNK